MKCPDSLAIDKHSPPLTKPPTEAGVRYRRERDVAIGQRLAAMNALLAALAEIKALKAEISILSAAVSNKLSGHLGLVDQKSE